MNEETIISLGEFERRHGINKGTASKAARDLGHDTSKGLSAQAYADLKVAYDLPDYQEPKPEPETQVTQPGALQVYVETGNHSKSITVPGISGTFDLSQFRASESVSIEDPLAVAAQFIEAANVITQEMDKDAAARELKLQQTRTAREMVANKAQELQLEQRLYRERTRAADMAQTQEAQALQDAMAGLQSLGKPQPDSAAGNLPQS